MVQLYGQVCTSHPYCLILIRPSLLSHSKPEAQLTSRHNLTEATREMVKKSTDDVKNLASFPAGGPHVRPHSTSLWVLTDGRHRGNRCKRSCLRNSPMPSLLSREFRGLQRKSKGVLSRARNGRLTGWSRTTSGSQQHWIEGRLM
jgi:hypothetical protein